MADDMRDGSDIVEILRKQYMSSKYGKLHQALLKNGIEAELYIGIGIEMYHPNAYNPSFMIHVFDEDNVVIMDRRESDIDDSKVQKTMEIAKSLGYELKLIDELTEEEEEFYFG